MSATPPPGRPNFGGWQPSVLAAFPTLAGWRETGGGLVVPPRRTLLGRAAAQSVPASSSATFTYGFGQPGVAGLGFTTTQNLEPEIDEHDGLLVEVCSLELGNASVAGALTVTAIGLFFNLVGSGQSQANLALIAPTLNALPTLFSVTYAIANPFAISGAELRSLGIQGAATNPFPPYVSNLSIQWRISVSNSNAGAQTFSALGTLYYRRFQGVSAS